MQKINALNVNQRSEWVDIAKGICIIFVVMMHSTLGVVDRVGEAGFMEALTAFAAPFRMPDFFLISGLFLGLVINRPMARFFDRKVVHFFYFYLLWLTIQFAFKAPAIALDDGPLAALQAYGMAFVQPFGTLWFIYALPVFFLVTRVTKVLPVWMVFGWAIVLHLLPVHTGWVLFDEFCSRYVFFFAGYAFANMIFDFATTCQANKVITSSALALWAVINGLSVSYGYSQMPFVTLILGFAGAGAIVALSAVLVDMPYTKAINWLGSHSIVVYLAFFLPMAATRTILLKTGIIEQGTWIAFITTSAAVIFPVLLYAMVQWSGWGKFLFERPAWASIEKTKLQNTQAKLVPAE